MAKNRNIVIGAFVFLFLFISVYFPGDDYHIKLIGYFGACLVGADVLLRNLKNRYYIPEYFLGIIFTIVAMLLSVVLCGNVSQTITQTYPAALILLVILIKEQKYAFEKWLMWMLFIMASIMCLLAILDLTGIMPIYSDLGIKLTVLLFNLQCANLGTTMKGIIHYVFFFRTSPLIALFIAAALKKGKYVPAVIGTVAMYLSGTRANFLAGLGVFGLGILLVLNEKVVDKKARKIIAIVVCVLVIAMIPPALKVFKTMQSDVTSTASDEIKTGQAIGILDNLKDPKTLLFGEGFGSNFEDMGREGLEHETAELSYLDLLRKGGLLLTIPFLAFIFAPFFWKIDWGKKLGYFGFLAISATNPFLYTSTGFVAYIYIYASKPAQTWFTKRLENKFGKSEN